MDVKMNDKNKTVMKLTLTFLLIISMADVFAQELRSRTNLVHISLQEPRSLTTVPSIRWITPKMEYTNSTEPTVKIEAKVSSDLPLQNVYISVGDNFSGASRGRKEIAIPDNCFSHTFTQNVVLFEGSNYIEVIAENVNGGKVSAMRNVLVGKDAVSDAVAIDRKDYALFFATDIYDYWGDLVNPVYDATTIALELKEKYGFEIEVVENPTQEEMLLKIKEYSKRNYKPQDQLFIFFAGHGVFDEDFGEGYVVAKNSVESDKAKTSYISHSNLKSYVNNIPNEHILLTLDVCFGGTLDPKIARTRGSASYEMNDNEFLARKLSKKTRRYLTSGGKEYVSDGLRGKHSPFAAQLLEALKTRGGEDGILTLSEMIPHLEKIRLHEPRAGEFGDNENGSDFVFVARQ
jgi:hypothetical protein